MTKEQLAEIRARLDAATPGPWTIEEGSGEDERLVFVRTERGRLVRTIWMNDATFIANAPADLRALLDEVEALQAEVRKQVFGSKVVFDREVVERAERAGEK